MSGMHEVYYKMFEKYLSQATSAEQHGERGDAARLYDLARKFLIRAAEYLNSDEEKSMRFYANQLQDRAEELKEDAEDMLEEAPVEEPKKKAAPAETKKAAEPEKKTTAAAEEVTACELTENNAGILQDLQTYFQRKRSGVLLLYGPPGCGKHMILQELKKQKDIACYEVKLDEWIDQDLEEVTQKTAELFEKAVQHAPAAICVPAAERFNDDLDLAGIWQEHLQTISARKNAPVLVLAVTHSPKKLPEEFVDDQLLVDRIYVGMPDDEARGQMMEQSSIPEEVRPTLLQGTRGFNCQDMELLCEQIRAQKISPQQAAGLMDSYRARNVAWEIEQIRNWEQYTWG